MKTILVSGASGVIGYGILKSLRQADHEYKLIGTTIYDDSVAPAFCDIFELAPLTKDENYLDWLIGIIKKHKVDMIIPGIDVDMQYWNKERKQLEATGTFVLLNNPDLIELCADKWLFYQKLQAMNSKLAIESRLEGSFEELKNKFRLPFLMKPRLGFAARGIVIVEDEETFAQHQHNLGPDLMAQPIIGTNDEEYTVSAFFDKDSRLRCFIGLRRKLAKEGFTEKAWGANLPGAKEAMLELAEHLLPVGPTNFQFRVHGGKLKLLEINPRISSATAIRAAFGYNEAAMSVEYFLNNVVPTQPAIRPGYAVRYAEEHIFYDRDTI